MKHLALSTQILGLLLTLLGCLPLRAELEGAGLEGGSDLGGNNGGKLSRGGLQAGRLQGGAIEPASLQGPKLEPATPQQAAMRLNPTALKLKAAELAEGGLGVDKIQGAASTIPRTQVGALLYDVAGVLLMRDEDLSQVAVGYYMAVLADPDGERHDDAFRRLKEILLDKDLDHARVVQLYDGGLETMKGLVDINIGLTADGYQSGLRTLQEIKNAYQERRKRETHGEPAAGLDEANPALGAQDAPSASGEH